MNKETRLILYGIKHLIERETFTPPMRKDLDNDLCNSIVDLLNPKKEDGIEMPKEEFTISKDEVKK